jgi:hypothetical protein
MKRRHFIGMDVHCTFSEVAAVTEVGDVVHVGRCATSIVTLVHEIEQVPRPRRLVIEEGPLADWLWRNLREHVDEMVICNPRRNHLIAKEGTKMIPLTPPSWLSYTVAATLRPCIMATPWNGRCSSSRWVCITTVCVTG